MHAGACMHKALLKVFSACLMVEFFLDNIILCHINTISWDLSTHFIAYLAALLSLVCGNHLDRFTSTYFQFKEGFYVLGQHISSLTYTAFSTSTKSGVHFWTDLCLYAKANTAPIILFS